MASSPSPLAGVDGSPDGVSVRASVSAAPTRQRKPRSPATGMVVPANDDPLQLAQLLSSRICHDLIGPIGIAAATDDLRDADHRIDEEALALVAESARAAASRLAFFRFAFGFGQRADGVTSSASIASLLDGALASARLRIEWRAIGEGRTETGTSIPIPVARLVLCLALMATEALPRGGVVSVKVAPTDSRLNVVVRATGNGARIPGATLDAYHAASCADLSPRTVVGYYARQVARRLSATVEVGGEPGSFIELAFATPSVCGRNGGGTA